MEKFVVDGYPEMMLTLALFKNVKNSRFLKSKHLARVSLLDSGKSNSSSMYQKYCTQHKRCATARAQQACVDSRPRAVQLLLCTLLPVGMVMDKGACLRMPCIPQKRSVSCTACGDFRHIYRYIVYTWFYTRVYLVPGTISHSLSLACRYLFCDEHIPSSSQALGHKFTRVSTAVRVAPGICLISL